MEQRSKEWHEMRKKMIGASDMPVIMGVSPYKTRYQLWCEKMGLIQPAEPTQWMQDGINREPEALAAFEEKHGWGYAPKVVVSQLYPFAMASLDGMNTEGEIVEIKCAGEKDHELAKQGQIPEKYYPQLQWQMFICNVSEMMYFSYRNKEDNVVVKVNIDEKYVDKMIQEAVQFYSLMESGTPPELSQRDIIKREDDTWALLAEEFKQASKALKVAEENEARLRQALICMSGGFNVEGAGIKITRTMRKGVIDYKAIPELEEIDLEQYRKPAVESWRVTVKENDF